MSKAKVILGGIVLAVGVLFGVNALLPGAASAEDCSTNSVIKCGVTTISALRSSYNKDSTPGTRNIYAAYGLTSAVINSGAYKSGTVTKSGQVIVDGKVVATGAHSAGREYIPGSTKRTSNGTTFYDRSTQTSFNSNSLSAFVFFDKSGKFIAAVLFDCGNPVSGAPTPVPVYSCSKLDKISLARDQFQFTTTAAASNGAVIKDYSYNFGDGTAATGNSKINHTYAKPGTYAVTVTVHVTVDGKTVTVPGNCKTTVTVAPAPVYACDKLSAQKLSRTNFTFTTTASAANGAKVKDYVYTFGDGTTATASSVANHTYAKPGTYTVTTTVHVTVNGKVVTAPGTCKTTVTVTPEMCPIPTKQQYTKDDKRCVEDRPSVTIQKLVNGKDRDTVAVNTNFTYTVIVKNNGNVDLKNVVVTDPAPADVVFVSAPQGTIKNNKWSITLPSLAVGKSQTFTIIAKLSAYKAGDIVNIACVETPTVPGGNPDACDSVPVDTPKLIEVCNTNTNAIETINEKDLDSSFMTTDLSKCQPTPTTPPTPPELPHTGLSDIFSGALGIGSLVGVSVAYMASRRLTR